MSSSSIDPALWEMVCARTGGILATVGPEGYPHLSNVNYLVDADTKVVFLTTTATRIKGRNLLRDPHAALHVQGDNEFHFAVVEGLATSFVAAEPGDAATDGLHHIFSAFRGPQERPAFDTKMIAKGRMVTHLAVQRVYGLIPPPSADRGGA